MTTREENQFVEIFSDKQYRYDSEENRLMQPLIAECITAGLLAEYADDQRRAQEHVRQTRVRSFRDFEGSVYDNLEKYHIAMQVGESDTVILGYARAAARCAGRCWYLAVTQNNAAWRKAAGSALDAVHTLDNHVYPWHRS